MLLTGMSCSEFSSDGQVPNALLIVSFSLVSNPAAH